GWAIFRSPTISYATSLLPILFGFVWQGGAYFQVQSFLTADKIAALLVGAFFALAPLGHVNWRLDGHPATASLKGFAALTIMICAIAALSARNFNPFIYFRFLPCWRNFPLGPPSDGWTVFRWPYSAPSRPGTHKFDS